MNSGIKEGRTPPASSRPLEHGYTWYLRDCRLHSLALPDTTRFGRGLSLCRDRRSIVARANFYQRVDNLQREKTKCAGSRRFQKRKNQTFFSFLPTAAVRESLRLFLESDILGRKIKQTSRTFCHSWVLRLLILGNGFIYDWLISLR